jgi:hypothetical protein
LGLAGLAVERVALTPLGVRVVQLVTADPDAAVSGLPAAIDIGQGVGTDPAAAPAGRWHGRTVAVAQAALALPHGGLSAGEFRRAGAAVPTRARTTTRLRERLANAAQDGRCPAEGVATFGVS